METPTQGIADSGNFLSSMARWYALRTLSRHERYVAHQLTGVGISTFLPTYIEIHRWSDRNRKVELPLFPGYLFVQANMNVQLKRQVSYTRGVAGFVAMGGEPISIPDEQMERVYTAMNIGCVPYHCLKVGQRVRVRGGALDGAQGILIAHNGRNAVVIAIDGIQRSLAVRIEGYDIELL